MAIDPPWRLDPFKRIVEVGWGSFRYFTIFERITYNFGTPSEMAIKNLPPGVDYTYPFPAPLYQRRSPKFSPSFDPVTPFTIKGLYSWGTGSAPSSESGVLATAEVGFGLLGKDLSVQVVMPGTLASRAGERITVFDGIIYSTLQLVNGVATGWSSFVAATQADLDAVAAYYASEPLVLSWSIQIDRSYELELGVQKHSITRQLFLAAKKFTKDGDTEDMAVTGPLSYIDSGNSDNPLPTKTATIEYTAKTKLIKITIG